MTTAYTLTDRQFIFTIDCLAQIRAIDDQIVKLERDRSDVLARIGAILDQASGTVKSE